MSSAQAEKRGHTLTELAAEIDVSPSDALDALDRLGVEIYWINGRMVTLKEARLATKLELKPDVECDLTDSQHEELVKQ